MKREIWLDYLRVAACFMVMVIHATEPFYLGGDGALILTSADAFWVAFFEAVSRCCVPLFLLASSYLLFPLHYSAGEFFRRRSVRILVPMLLWTLVYAFVFGDPVSNLKGLLLNFNYAAGHLWFVYMLAGVYLLMPLLSPWAEKVGKKELSVYLCIWLLTLFFPYVREWAGGIPPLIQAADGLPAAAPFPLWGEASWNSFGTFYYVSGFVGFLLLGLYVKKFLPGSRKEGAVGAGLYLLGAVCIFCGLLHRFSGTGDVFPLSGDLQTAVAWEVPITYCSFFVFCTSFGLLLVFRRIGPGAGENAFYRNVLLPLSRAGYGMYLAHMLLLGPLSAAFRRWLGIGADGIFGVWTTPVQVLATALGCFLLTGLACIFVQRIPKIGKYLIG